MRYLLTVVWATSMLFGCERETYQPEKAVDDKVEVDLVIKDALHRSAIGRSASVLYDGCDVETTIDNRLQRKVKEIICRNADTNDSGVAIATVLRVEDGAVLAMTDCGDDVRDMPLALCYLYEPGAVMMPLTAAIAIEKDIVRMDTRIGTDRNDERYYKLPGDGGHLWPETMQMRDAIIRSSCIVMGKVGYDLGEEQMYDGYSAFGIGKPTKIGYMGEGRGILPRRGYWDRVSRSRIPNGQGVAVTLLQVTRAYAILARGGEYVEPYVVSGVKNKENVIYRHHKGKTQRVVSKATSDQVLEVLADVPSGQGTAPRAAVSGVSVAGKTGTAQRADTESFRYFPDRFRATFVGCFPSAQPRYVVGVMIETRRVEGERGHQGGQRPAVAFSEIVNYMVKNH